METKKDYSALEKMYGLPPGSIVWKNSGIAYSRLVVKTKEQAEIVSSKVKGRTVNGGMYDGMPLGGIVPQKDGTFEVYC